MSNVIKSSSSYSNKEQPGVIGKVYEELFTDSSGLVSVRYLRCFKASTGGVSKGDVIGAAGANVGKMYSTGLAVKSPGAGMEIGKLYGVAVADVAEDSYGFCVCRGIMEKVSANGVIGIGGLLATHATAGMVTNLTIGAGLSSQILGYSMTVAAGASVTAYISIL